MKNVNTKSTENTLNICYLSYKKLLIFLNFIKLYKINSTCWCYLVWDSGLLFLWLQQNPSVIILSKWSSKWDRKPTKMTEIRTKLTVIKKNEKLNLTVLAGTRKQEQDGKYYETDALIHPAICLFFNILFNIYFAFLISISSFPINISHYVSSCILQIAHIVFVWAVDKCVSVPCGAILTNVTFIWVRFSSLYQNCFEDTERIEFPLLLAVTLKYVQKQMHSKTFSTDGEKLHLHPSFSPTGTLVIYEASPSV